MWNYERRLEYPVNMRYLSQRYACPYREVAAVLTDIGTEELAHLEMVAAIVHQLTRNLSMEEIEESGFANYYTDHTLGIWRYHHRSDRGYGSRTKSPFYL